jgi:DNA-binding NtrC family response regulator
MRATIHIECTPAEARLYLGLPDVQPIQAAVLERLQEAMVSEIDRFSPEALMNQWLSAFPENVARLQEMVATMFLGGSGQVR